MKNYCKKCNENYSGHHKFCYKCGGKLTEKEEHKSHKTEERPIINKTHLIIGGLVIIGLLIFFAIPIPYKATEHRITNVPYDAQESYTEKESYEDCTQRSYNADVYGLSESGEEYGRWVEGSIHVATKVYSESNYAARYRIKNYEDDAGLFIIKFTLWQWESFEDQNAIDSFTEEYNVGGNSHQDGVYYDSWMIDRVKDKYNIENLAFTAELIKPNIKDCKISIKPTTKYRTITKYKEESKDIKVTKFATLFQMTTRQVDWYYEVRV